MFHRRCLVLTVVATLSCGARADVVFVDDDNCPGPGSGAEGDPFCSIQTAIDMATDGDEIIVAAGTYFETVNFLGKAVELRSADGPEVTTIDGRQTGTVVTCDTDEGPGTVLEGFTLTGGSGTNGAGGGMLNRHSSPTVVECTFTGNSAAQGGGMYSFDGNPTIAGCTFAGNSSLYGGGGMYNRQSNPPVTGCSFIGNTGGSGAGMLNDNSSPTVRDCSFVGNATGYEGGGMQNEGYSNPTVVGCAFRRNIAAHGGGVFNVHYSEPTLIRCIFSDNTATGSSQNRGGGAVANDDHSSPTLVDCTFTGNHAAWGGGVNITAFNAPPMTVSDCTFVGNTADQSGGAMYIKWNPAVVTRCTFIDNAAEDKGGAMFSLATSGKSTVAGCRFVGNTAAAGGGMHNSFTSPSITNCAFEANFATGLGGGMFGEFFERNVSNCTFSGNSARGGGGAVHLVQTSDVKLINCVVWDNGPDAISLDGLSTISSLYSDIQGGWPGAGNIDADPMFVDPAAGDLRLTPGSPCIDAGHNWYVGPDLGDVDADGDTTELVPFDLDGNPRFAGDRAVADTGCGVPVIVDMGAYELPGVAVEIVIADLNGDGVVGLADLMIVNGCIGSADLDCCIADVDLDGVVGPADRALVRSAMLAAVPAPASFTADCNNNGLSDYVDIQSGTSLDCNGNAVPDECDNSRFDCNNNNIPDECDIADGTSLDSDGDGLPDECEAGTNDTCEYAIVVVDGTTPFATLSATGGVPGAICEGVPALMYNDIWFLYTAPCTGIATFSVCNDADFDTVLALYFAGNCTQVLNPLACNDNAPGCGQTSEVQQLIVEGLPYLIRVGGADWHDAGVGTLTVSCEP